METVATTPKASEPDFLIFEWSEKHQDYRIALNIPSEERDESYVRWLTENCAKRKGSAWYLKCATRELQSHIISCGLIDDDFLTFGAHKCEYKVAWLS